MTFNPLDYQDGHGHFIKYVWPGGYPVFYLTSHSTVLCAGCAEKSVDDYNEAVEAADINWEDRELSCDECNEPIEAAYSEDTA